MNILELDFSNYDESHIASSDEFLLSTIKFVEMKKVDLSSLDENTKITHLMRTGACMMNMLSFTYRMSYGDCVAFSVWIRMFVEMHESLQLDTIKKDDYKSIIAQLEKSYNAVPKLPEQENQEGDQTNH